MNEDNSPQIHCAEVTMYKFHITKTVAGSM